ncbi:AGE family epimerase/isomerase [Sediminitomix flava]|uniref:Putative secreted protein (Por secretion system target) n=1 Tax=Sediminitomix flava TaxID=379075 RepID=A0A315ZEK1_SEDFL|nr:AGE family epimerase/isomerase [Sediminitomix flava]PWJ43995.1 putative secreted protein (Por secretion system target) [Sediminitomix flava]
MKMKKLYSISISLIGVLINTCLFGQQVQVTSPYFQNPELLIDFADDCAKFWSGVHDPTYGGFYTFVNKEGNATNTSEKHLVSLSRDAYGMTRAFMLTGNEEYLQMASSSLDFIDNHLWDENYGGWHRSSNRSGSSPRTGDKTAFDQHYALLGNAAFYEATRSSNTWNVIEKGLDHMNEVYWDDRTEYLGYFHKTNTQSENPNGKSFNSTVDAITTHLYPLYLTTGDQQYLDRLNILKSNMIEYLVGSMDQSVIGFAEEFDSEWNIDHSQNRTIMGHVLKTAWCLGRIHRIDQDNNAINAAEVLIDDVLQNGYDHIYGGPFKDYDRTNGQMMMYGISDKAKAWWQMEQAITSGFILFDITKDEKYLQMTEESLDFFMDYFVDPTYGEIYADRAQNGSKIPQWGEDKGNDWKAAYHSIETAYYAYLYSQLLLKQEGASLYYNIEASNTERELLMNPLAIDFDKLKIQSVSLNGENFTDFNRDTRIVTLPANVEGKLKVTYIMEGLAPISVIDPLSSPTVTNNISIFPNPTKDVLFIESKTSNTSYRVLNILGNLEMSGTLNKLRDQINVSSLKSGIYFLQVDDTTIRFIKE